MADSNSTENKTTALDRTRTIHLPSGLKGVVRNLRTSEVNLFGDKRSQREGTVIEKVLSACWVETTDPGPYTINGSGKPDWSSALTADRFCALIDVRVATHGSEYAFKHQCEACGKRFEWSLDLDSDLERKPIPEASLDRYRGGNKFETALSDGTRVVFHLSTGADERKATKLARKTNGDDATLAAAARIDEIDGVHPNDKLRFIDALPWQEVTDLIDAFDEHDGGVETAIEIECPECDALQDVTLPFDRAFLMPTKKRRKTKGRQ